MKLRFVGWMAAGCAWALLAGCATTSPNGETAAAGVDALYAQLDQATRQYDDALQLARQGDSDRSESELAAALDAMRNASDRCLNMTGCDTERFLAAYDRALRLKDGSFLGTDPSEALVDTGDQNDADADSGVLLTLPQAQRTVELLHDHKLSDLVANNGAVQASLRVWLTRLRPNLIRAWVDYQYLRYQMWPAFDKAGLPEAILFGILAKESGGRVHAVSRSGAAGPLQFMPATGSRFGLNTVAGFDQRFDPSLAAQAGAAYLDEQLGRLNDDLALVLAAYNGGEGRVGRLVDRTHATSFWNPKVYFGLPSETRAYVPMVLAAAWLFLHPERYHLSFPKVDRIPGHVNLATAVSLNGLSVCLGNGANTRYGWYRTLRNLNPQLRPSHVQPKGTRINLPKFLEARYRQSCVHGKWLALASQLQSAQLPDPPPVRHYTVRSGDTLSAISRRFHCDSARDLARDNGLRVSSTLRIGKRLRLEGCRR